MIYIIHLLNSIPNYHQDFDFEKANGYIPIHKETLRKRIHDYRFYLDYLIENGIIEEGTSYIVGKRSTGLRFTTNYLTKVKSIKIFCSTLIKSLVTNNDNRDLEAERKLSFLKKWFNTNLTIGFDHALDFLEKDKDVSRKKVLRKRELKNYTQGELRHLPTVDEIVIMGYNSKFITVDRINNADFDGYPKIDKTTGRLHSPLTQLKKGMRKYLRYEDEILSNIDIVNSQPLLSLIVTDINVFNNYRIGDLIAKYNNLYKSIETYNPVSNKVESIKSQTYTMLVNLIKSNSSKQDVIIFKKAIIEGNFYEVFGNILQNQDLIPSEILEIQNPIDLKIAIRDFAKKSTFRAFFEKIYAAKWCKFVRAFKACFPNVYEIFQLIKKGKGNHNTLACIFQRFESWLILHNICVEVNGLNPHIPLFTIHDSICTTKSNADIVYNIFLNKLKSILGVEPKLQIESWE